VRGRVVGRGVAARPPAPHPNLLPASGEKGRSVIRPAPFSGELFQIHAKHFQISGLFLQTFPKIPSSVLCEIKGLQEGQAGFRFAPNLLRRPRSERPRPAAPARRAWRKTLMTI
jgi:hypothetical protein